MIILHGLLGSLDNWQTLARRFSENFKVYTIDQRNHGQSPHSDDMDYDLLSTDLADFIREHAIVDPILIGHSMGGKTVMKYALEHPESVSALIPVDMSPRDYAIHHDHILEALMGIDFNVLKSRKEVEAFLMKKLNNMGIVLFLSKNIYWIDKDQLAFRFNLDVLYKNLDLISGWPYVTGQFKGKTLFIRGAKANYISKDEPNILTYFPNALIKDIDAGHWVHAEKPEAFYEAVMDFLT
jgi:pimeloyl-ACP methyl ester carboxylesterase